MTEPIKVHEGLREVKRDQAYHLGHFAVDFQDGELRFELFARICPEANCPCDNIQIDWHAAQGGNIFHSWLGADGSWKQGASCGNRAERHPQFPPNTWARCTRSEV